MSHIVLGMLAAYKREGKVYLFITSCIYILHFQVFCNTKVIETGDMQSTETVFPQRKLAKVTLEKCLSVNIRLLIQS